MGVPFLANSQVGFFYPFNWPLWALLETPYAVSASILIHLVIAGLGTYLFARRVLDLSPVAALLAAMLFSLGGYLTAQVEHINQLQGLAWLPWLFVAAQPVVGNSGTAISRSVDQDLFIRWRDLCPAIAGRAHAVRLYKRRGAFVMVAGASHLRPLKPGIRMASRGVAGCCCGVAVLLAAVQLLPTLELTGQSARQGGLSTAEVLSFSWHPLLITRSLLPGYGQSLFTEYVAFLPLTALVLAMIGAWRWRERPQILGLLVLVIAGLILAMGRFTPVYWLLANLPGFDLFRVPARWLVLYALGAALLAGLGWDTVMNSLSSDSRARLRQPVLWGVLLIAALMIWGFAAGLLDGIIPTGAEAPFERPGNLTVIGWLVELVLLGGLLFLALRSEPRGRRGAGIGLPLLAGIVLWFSSRTLPYNNLTTPEAYFDIRPPAARLMALTDCLVPGEACPTPPDRFLSLSDIFFDPGDQAEIDSIYSDQLDADARYDYTVAVKQKEIIAPNLPMVYGLYAVDGFDGGVLPLATYSEVMQLVLPDGETTSDGRLREYLDAVPEARWLDLFNTRYLITDKVRDTWRQGVFFDRQFPVTLTGGETASVGFVPSFSANAVWLLAAANAPDIQVETISGEQWSLTPELLEAPDLYRIQFPETDQPATLTLTCPPGVESCGLDALTLVDTADSAFQTVIPGPFRQIYSGDVKIYEYLDVAPRAWIVHDWLWQPDVAASVLTMQDGEFDPHRTAVLAGEGAGYPDPPGSDGNSYVSVTSHSAEQVDLTVSTEQVGLVVLADANYPGWQAILDGQPVPIQQTDGLFRGVFVPAGEHSLTFRYESSPFHIGLLLTVVVLAAGVLVWILAYWRSRQSQDNYL
ncbi:MAG: hypothetical protein R3C44_04040 [Chloroflexota bacterium]